MRPNQDDWEAELLELAETTEQLADAVTDPVIAARLRAMAEELLLHAGTWLKPVGRLLSAGVNFASSICQP